jgi:hypothetical protein
VVATRLHLHGNAVRTVLREIGLLVLAPNDLAPDGELGHDVLHVSGGSLLCLDRHRGARDEVAL